MFTLVSFFLSKSIGSYADDCNANERNRPVAILSDDEVRTAILQARQDLKLIAFFLAAIFVALAVIADLVLYTAVFKLH
jgi:hypothetical protein